MSNLSRAEEYCRDLTTTHYENFQVFSYLLPKALRQDFCNIYAYCRTADDLADESESPEAAGRLLLDWRRQLNECYQGRSEHPVFEALAATIERHEIPIDPFDHLLDAFLQDQIKTRYQDWQELMGYCRNSANPVGRLVLYLFGYRDQERHSLSDATCTALQLANFWQDVDRDLEKGRVYVPLEEMERFGYSLEQFQAKALNPAFRELMASLVDRTERLFRQGRQLVPMLEGRASLYVRLFSDSGERLLRKIRKLDYDTFRRRPVLSSRDKLLILLGGIAKGKLQ